MCFGIYSMDKNTQTYFNCAKKLLMNVAENDPTQGFVLNLAQQQYHFYASVTPWNNCTSTLIIKNKFLTNQLLNEAKIPVPNAKKLEAKEYSLDKLIAVTKEMKFPLAVKPLLWTEHGGEGTDSIPDVMMLHSQCELLFKSHPAVLLEEHHEKLQSYHILIFKDKIISVIDNANNTNKINVKKKNSKNDKSGKILNPNIMSTENSTLFIKAAKLLELELIEFHVRCKSLHEPIANSGGIIVDANYNPNISIHDENQTRKTNPIGLKIMRGFIFKHPIGYLFHVFFKTKIGLMTLALFFVSIFLLYLLQL